MIFLGLFLACMGESRPECEPASAFNIFMMLLRFLAAILSIDAFHTKPSQRFNKSPRRIDSRIRGSPIHRDTLMLLKNILEEPTEKPEAVPIQA